MVSHFFDVDQGTTFQIFNKISMGNRDSTGGIVMYQQSKHLKTQRAGVDRRCGLDRRIAYDLEYFVRGGLERRTQTEKREYKERRADWVKSSPWSSVSKLT